MIIHEEPFGFRVVVERLEDIEEIELATASSMFLGRRLSKIEPTHASLGYGVPSYDLHIKES